MKIKIYDLNNILNFKSVFFLNKTMLSFLFKKMFQVGVGKKLM